MPYIIYNKDEHKFVAPVFTGHSFVKNANNARIFHTLEAAEADCCGNEKVMYYVPEILKDAK